MEAYHEGFTTVVAQGLVGIFSDPLGIGIDLKPENDPGGGMLLLDEIEDLAHRVAIVRIVAVPESADGIGLARDLLREESSHPSVPAEIHPQQDRLHSRLLEDGEVQFLLGILDRAPVTTDHTGKRLRPRWRFDRSVGVSHGLRSRG